MPDFTTTTDSKLERLYKGKQRMVAFLDETYLSKPIPGVPFFFAMTAVVMSSGDIDSVRWAYAEQAGHSRWHTTEKFRDGGADEIRGFVDLLVKEADPVLVVIQSDDQLHLADHESARRACFITLVTVLREIHDVQLVVYERRRPGLEQDQDDETARMLRKRFETMNIVDAWSGSEPLLWGPDVVAWTLQRRIVARESWFDPLLDVVNTYSQDGSPMAEPPKRGG